jgi:hypothetical protein
MGYPTISWDLKLAAIRLYENDILDLEDILHSLDFSRRTFYSIWRLWRDTGDVVKPRMVSVHGRMRNLDFTDLQYLLQLIHDYPDYFLNELLHLLKTNRFILVHYTTIHRELDQAGMSVKS